MGKSSDDYDIVISNVNLKALSYASSISQAQKNLISPMILGNNKDKFDLLS